MSVFRSYLFIPLQNWLFTPELQWQSRDKWRILQGCKRETPGPALADGDMSLGDEELLFSLCPPEPVEDWERVVTSFEQEHGYLTTLFRYYSMLNSTGVAEVAFCGKRQFEGYAAEVQVLDRRSLDLNAGCASFVHSVPVSFLNQIEQGSPYAAHSIIATRS